MRAFATAAVLAALLVPGAVEAQGRAARYNPFSFTPYIGLFNDPASDQAAGLLGFQAGYHESDRTRLHANLGYGLSGDNQWALLAAGAEFALLPGATTVAAGAEAGVAWRDATSQPVAPWDDEGWVAYPLVAPTLSLRQRVSDRLTLGLVGHVYILDVFESAQLAPALTLGLSIR